MPNWTALSFQDNASPFMEHILFFHDHSMIILIFITLLTLYLIISLTKEKPHDKFIVENQEIETIWTILPSLMLIFIAIPSLKNLYLMENTSDPSLTVKVTGHQWYWSYEYSSLGSEETESFMENSNILRLLKTSDMLKIPVNVTTRILITSADVIHSWTIPSLGVKADALPGRLNQVFLLPKRIGVFSGQCSEICGTNHSFMPILALLMSQKEFLKMK